jgi:hypothetical protein
MDPQNYPGRGLTLSQLIFALKEELKTTAHSPLYVAGQHRYLRKRHVDFLCSFTFDQVSQLDHDASTVLAGIREWKNSFAPINRLPFDVLSLIPTYLSSHNDRLRASFVCRQWRRTFLQRGDLWSELILSKDEVYVKTFLERSNGSALDIFTRYWDPAVTWKLLSAHTEQIRRLNFDCDGWFDIQEFADVISWPLPLLHTLTINNIGGDCNVLISQLLDFLEASPTLHTLCMDIIADRPTEAIPEERVVVLPNVKTFTLIMGDRAGASELGYGIAAHLSCPSAVSTSFVHMGDRNYEIAPGQIFPDPVAWRTIVPQYTKGPVEKATLEIEPCPMTCELTFWSLGESKIHLFFKTRADDDHELEFILPSESMHQEVFTQATRTILDHPQLESIKRFHICHSLRAFSSPRVSHIASQVGQLFKSLGPLDELMIYHCDIRPYFYLNHSNNGAEERVVFPPTKELIISYPFLPSDDQHLEDAEVAGLQYAMEKPVERLIIRGVTLSVEMEQSLRRRVNSLEITA